jgi:hypothetical protein
LESRDAGTNLGIVDAADQFHERKLCSADEVYMQYGISLGNASEGKGREEVRRLLPSQGEFTGIASSR